MAIAGIAYVIGTTATITAMGVGLYALGFAINMIVASVISKALFNPNQPSFDGAGAGSSPNLGNRQQIPPATDNKLPVVYGSAYVGGQVTDLSITENNQELYYALSICEVTGTETGQTVSNFTFGNIYWGGKLVNFQANGYTVASLLDESTGVYDTTVNGLIEFYLYSNGSNNPINSPYTAIQVMSNPNLIYQWDETKLMSNTVFAIVHITYNQPANVVGLVQTKFQVNNNLSATGNCIYDYLLNTRYGGAIPLTQIDTTSLNALTAYSEELITYTLYSGGTSTQKRFTFNGVIDTNRTIMQNLQDMASCCDCLIKYSEMFGTWGVIVQSPTYTLSLALNDSNVISGITTTPLDIANSFNIAEVKFPDNTAQDSFNTSIFDLSIIDPSLLYPNEPINKQTISLPLTNNSVSAQLIAYRFLKTAREDLQVSLSINYIGLQLDAGDIVSLTNVNYGWSNKLFRCQKITQTFSDSGQITANLSLSEFNPQVYDDTSITEFTPAPNTGIGDPTFFGIPNAPIITTQQPTAINPSFQVNVTTSPAGITQYAEVWYSAFANPTSDQRIFAGTTAIQSNGNPYNINTLMPAVTLSDIPSGNWYFFSRMVNSLAVSSFSPASSIFNWRPSTFQYIEKYLAVAYATSITGTGFSLNPTNKTYYGLVNLNSNSVPVDPAEYTWYQANPNFGTISYLLFTNRSGRKFSFATGPAGYASGSASFVPTQISTFDPSIWSGLPIGTNVIDLDIRTGQVLQTGTTTVGTGQIGITNNPDGTIVAGLQQYLDFGGPYTKTSSVATLTIDVYGRVVGFEEPDAFYFTKESFTATSGQTVFTVTRSAGYISGQCFVFQNGLILDTTEYTDTGGTTGTLTLSIGATLNDIITIVSVKSSNATTGVYASFTRNTVALTTQTTYIASGFTLIDGHELLFLNGTVVNAQDYNIIGQDITFISETTGNLQVIIWTGSNLGIPTGNPVNVDTFTVIGQPIYPFSFDVNAFNLYNNGCLQKQGVDYTTATGTYTLTTTPTSISNILTQQTFTRTGAV
jgi:hypothetical protein